MRRMAGAATPEQQAVRTLVCSVLFLDVVGYSRKSGDEQVRVKQAFNDALHGALQNAERNQCVVLDTGDGAAITFLGDPEQALFAALAMFDNAGHLELRMGINLGPVSLMRDVNGLQNAVGDGINVARRIMEFAERGELLVSRSFYEVVALLSGGYTAMFTPGGSRADKHGRAHEVYAVSEAVRGGRKVAAAQSRQRSERRPDALTTPAAPAQVFDAGTHFVVSGASPERVQEALDALASKGCKQISPVERVG